MILARPGCPLISKQSAVPRWPARRNHGVAAAQTSMQGNHAGIFMSQLACRKPSQAKLVCLAADVESSVEQENTEVASESPITVAVEKSSWSSRVIHASVEVCTGVSVVWGCLTDYDHLANFIPSLVENECLERYPNGARLRQVGEQVVLPGVKFSAECTLECFEFPEPGVPPTMLQKGLGPLPPLPPSPSSSSSSSSSAESPSSSADAGDSADGGGAESPSSVMMFPYPAASLENLASRDITFAMTDGDFKDFRGLWRLQPGPSGADSSCRLCYSLYVQPQSWLPVRLLQGRIEREVNNNLQAVRRHAQAISGITSCSTATSA